MGKEIEQRFINIAVSSLLLASTIAVGLVRDNNKSEPHPKPLAEKFFVGEPCSLAGQQKIEHAVKVLDGRNVQGVSVSECQTNGRWFNDGTIYISTNYPAPEPPIKK